MTTDEKRKAVNWFCFEEHGSIDGVIEKMLEIETLYQKMNMMKQLRRRQAKDTAREEATRLVLDRWADFCKKADTVILYTLCMDEHYGKKRAERFYFRMLENQTNMIEQFRTGKDDDETYYLVMAERIRQHGIDIDELLAKADRLRMPECDYEERQRLLNEYRCPTEKGGFEC